MNFKQLEILLAILEHGSFSAGARATFVSQSTASQSIAGLEQELGVRLLERTASGVTPTSTGKVFKKHARQILADLALAYDVVEKHRGLENTNLRIAASTIPGAYLVPPVLAKLCETRPTLSVTLLQGDSRDTVTRVSDREVDVGVVGSRFEEKGLSYSPIGRDVIRLVAAPGGRFASGDNLAVTDLVKLPLILREAGSGTAKVVLDALAKAGVDTAHLNVRAYMGSNEAVKGAVLGGMGVAFLSEIAIRREVERGDLLLLSVADIEIRRNFHLVKRTGTELGATAAFFWDAMAAACGEP